MEKLKDVKLDKDLANIEPNQKVLFDAVILAQASLRQGTHSTKTRSEVSGGGRKPWRQKGTGHARQGSIRAVQWVGGGRYGTPVPRDYSIKQNRKERRLALQTAFLNLYNEKAIVVVDELKVATPKTKDMVAILNSLELSDKKVLIVTSALDENLILASRNLGNVMVIQPRDMDVLVLMNANCVLTTKDTFKEIEEVLK